MWRIISFLSLNIEMYICHFCRETTIENKQFLKLIKTQTYIYIKLDKTTLLTLSHSDSEQFFCENKINED